MIGRPRRSCLYMPGTNARAHEKARELACDVVIFDLEDSVAPESKTAARERIVACLEAGGYGARELVVRVYDTGMVEDPPGCPALDPPDGLEIRREPPAGPWTGVSVLRVLVRPAQERPAPEG